MKFLQRPLMIIQSKVAEPLIVFQPTLDDCCNIIKDCFAEIVEGSKQIPRVR